MNIEEILRDRILYIGEQIPEGLTTDKRPKQVYLGYPQELIDQCSEEILKEMEKRTKGYFNNSHHNPEDREKVREFRAGIEFTLEVLEDFLVPSLPDKDVPSK